VQVLTKALYGWDFEPAFAFTKAKNQPKNPKVIDAFA
jgi:hypothetical protein